MAVIIDNGNGNFMKFIFFCVSFCKLSSYSDYLT